MAKKHKTRQSQGFTLVEILIIAPIVILIIGAFIGFISSLVGDVLASRDQSTLVYETQAALNRIEQDTRISTQFLTTTGALTAPQGSDNNYTGTAAFTNTSNSLLLTTLTTDQNPQNGNRSLVYYANQPNACGSTQTHNRALLSTVIYFINGTTLWRRVTIPPWDQNSTVDANTVCSAPWQKNTCSPGYVLSQCQTNDEQILQNISNLNVQYFSTAGSTTDIGAANAGSAVAMSATITSSKNTAGRTVSTSATIRASKLNNTTAAQPVPPAPSVSHSLIVPNTVQFNWTTTANATSYQVGYQVNGGAWVNQSYPLTTTSITVTGNRNDVINFRAAGVNSTGQSVYSTDTQTLPAWGTCSLQNSWGYYGSGYATPGFTMTSSGVVMLKGLVSGGTTTGWTTICVLPVGYRPSNQLIFQNATNSAAGRVDILPTGEVQFVAGSNAWFSLDGVNFVSTTASPSWTTLTLQHGWVNYGGAYSPLESTVDTTGRVHVQGLVKSGTYTDRTVVAALPAGSTPALYQHLPAVGSPTTPNYLGVDSTGVNAKGDNSSGYYSLQAMFYPSSFSGWSNLTLQNGWATYDATSFATPQYTKSADGVVTVKGLIKSGTTTGGTVIANLPAGYRPLERLLTECDANNAFGRIDIFPNGDIVAENVSSSFTSLDAITFMGDQ